MSLILVRYAEIGLKSNTVRTMFENRLKDNILTMFSTDRIEARVTKGDARFYVEVSDADQAVLSLRRVFGIASLSIVETCSSNLDDICKTAAEYSIGRISEGQSFAVKARREGQNHPYTSVDVGREAGSAIFVHNGGKIKVDLSNPEVIFYIEVRRNKSYIFDSYIKCNAGLPVGTQGRVIAEVNDDRGVVSAWLMMKRGCKLFVIGSGDKESLLKYDPDLKIDHYNPGKIMGYVMGTTLENLAEIDVSDHDVPVYFPTIGMTDTEVSNIIDKIKNGL